MLKTDQEIIAQIQSRLYEPPDDIEYSENPISEEEAWQMRQDD